MSSGSRITRFTRPIRSRFGSGSQAVVPAVIAIGVTVSLLLAWALWQTEVSDADEALATRHRVVIDSIERDVSQATLRLASVSGLFQASNEVTELEFRRFVKKLGLPPGVQAIGYLPLVMDWNRDLYEATMRESIPGFTMFELDENGEKVRAASRRVHYPMQWYEPTETLSSVTGFDSNSNQSRAEALEMSRVTRDVAATPFLSLVSETESDGFVLYWPITDAETDALTGHAAAAMDMSLLVDDAIPESFNNLLTWEVHDITDMTADDQQSISPDEGKMTFGGRVWQVQLTPNPGTDMVPDASTPAILMIGGLLSTMFIAIGLSSRRKRRSAEAEYERLQDLAQAKDKFLASVGHELRTPLTSVVGYAELLRDDSPGVSDEDRAVMISTIADEAADLASIVDDLLVAARTELDTLVVQKLPVDARAQTAQVLEAIGRADRDPIRLVGGPDVECRAIGDPGRVRQILRNLVTNAYRYGGDEVVVRLAPSPDRVAIQVLDDGSGVNDEDAGRIFDPYFRAHSMESQPAALGIGLAVARQLARMMDGDLTYQRVSGWTVFELSLPAAPDVARTEDLVTQGATDTTS